jgi:dihydropteroate synthase
MFVIDCGGRSLDLSQPCVMGVLNVTPDSFSDGGQAFTLNDALRRAEAMIAAGVAILDVGGESTRPGAPRVDAAEEIRRIAPIIAALSARFSVPISVDTSKPEAMSAAVDAGAGLINDVRALRLPGALEMAAGLGVPVCLMHMQGEPGTMQQRPNYVDVVGEVTDFLSARMAACAAAGIPAERVLLDPGFGFGKTLSHNLALLSGLGAIVALGRPVLVGLSRKSMIGTLTGRPVAERLAGSVAAALLAVERGATLVRAHDVAETVDALAVAQAVHQVVS